MNRSWSSIFSLIVLSCSSTLAYAETPSGYSPEVSAVRYGAQTTDYRSVGLLLSNRSLCTATVLPGGACALTAAHCVTGSSPEQLGFSVYDQNLGVEQVGFLAPNQNGQIPDLAILKLEKTEEPLASQYLLDHGTELNQVERVTVVGYGANTGEIQTQGLEKRVGQMELGASLRARTLDHTFSSNVFYIYPDNQAHQTVCAGDSGGPVLHNNTLVGVISAGYERETPGVLCVRKHPSRTRISRNNAMQNCAQEDDRFISTADGCYDKNSSLIWGKRVERSFFEEATSFINYVQQRSDYPGSYESAENFCRTLNNPTRLAVKARRRGLNQPGLAVLRKLKKYGADSKHWRLPSEFELRRVSGDRSQILQNLVRKVGKDAQSYWFGQSSDTLYYRAVYWRSNDTDRLPPRLNSCDLQQYSEAVQLDSYVDQLRLKMDELGCQPKAVD